MVIVVGILAMGCEVDDFTTEINNTNAPELQIVDDSAMDSISTQVANTIRVHVADADPGLSYISMELKDSAGDVVYGKAEKLTGTIDTVTLNLRADSLEIGNHVFEVSVQDTEGLTTSISKTIYVRGVQSNQDQMFVLGTPNEWIGTDLKMSLVTDFTWRVPMTITDTTEFKFANTPDWSGQDWTDTDCDGVLESGSGNIACGAQGRVFVYFNDNTYEWWTEPIESNYDEMYIMGDMNGWAGPDLQMALVEDHLWQIEGVTIEEGNQFKFANTYTWSGKDWGDGGCDGFAEEATGGGANTDCNFDGTFTITFNDQTTAYELIEE
ncbi:hypothetical protein AB9P05_18040 [Roseivirga sp. BDSF3-8]|uniref:hypothetical protein n=1 Tax=Roseivirga sp. BDSF3-8 TaxID=3241598 RepID=UPI003531C65F